MKKLIFLILFPVLLFAQGGANKFVNPYFSTDTDWTKSDASITISGGLLRFTTTPAAKWAYEANATVGLVNTQHYMTGFTIISVSSGAFNIRQGTANSTLASTVGRVRADYTANTGANVGIWTDAGGTCTIDSAYIGNRLDTIYVVSATGNDAAEGAIATPVKTMFQASWRGYYSTGIININGTFDEYVEIGQSFGKLYASAASTITTVDFNSVTGTVDLANLTITTKLNDANITYLNAPSSESILQHPKWEGWPDWEQ